MLAVGIACLATAPACDALLELDDFSLPDGGAPPARDQPCTGDSDCDALPERAVCSVKRRQCVPLLTQRCQRMYGAMHDDPHALRLGALFTLHGPQAATNQARVRSAQLAIEEINAQGGIPTAAEQAGRPLSLITCDTGDDPLVAGRHLLEDLGVTAILGPNSSEDTLTLATRLSIAAHALTLSPTAMASSLRELADQDLSWMMAPTDQQRGPLLVQQIHALEDKLSARRSGPIKLSVIYRNDVFGQGTRLSLSSVTLNGKALSHPDNLASYVRLSSYDPEAADLQGAIDEQRSFGPDIVVLAGAAEIVSGFLDPFETQLHEDPALRAAPRPFYVLTDASKVAELLELAQRVSDLAPRLRGIGVASVNDSVRDAFERAFRERFAQSNPQLAGLGATYDAIYAISYAAAAMHGDLTGSSLAMGLRSLSGGDSAIATGPGDLQRAFQLLSGGAAISAQATSAALVWDERGAPAVGVLEVWCVAVDSDSAGFMSSGLRYDLVTNQRVGGAGACADAAHGSSAPATAWTDVAVQAPSAHAPAQPGAAHGAMRQGAQDADMQDDSDAGLPEPDRPELIAEYRAADSDPHDGVIGPWLRVRNRGTGAGVPLGTVELRYYLTNETNPLCVHGCVAQAYWAGLMPEGVRVGAAVDYESNGFFTGYLQVSFPTDAPALRPGEYVEVQLQFHTQDYAELDETNDYSFDASAREFTETRRVTIYRDDVLVWGEPFGL